MRDAATPKTRKLAAGLVAREAASGNPSENGEAFRACEKMRRHLSKFTGIAGFRALLSRALTLASAEIPWLGSVEVKEDGSLAGLDTLLAQQNGDEASKGGVVLIFP
ncbi:MAG TPA: hypothetical protein VLS90_17260 [Thermodesulfobacteriota bacterium]|nr:hypothetical protein [Thermodesulfobacteriota bacterium]